MIITQISFYFRDSTVPLDMKPLPKEPEDRKKQKAETEQQLALQKTEQEHKLTLLKIQQNKAS